MQVNTGAIPHVIDATLLSALSTLLWEIVIVSGHYCSHTTLVALLMTITFILPLSGDAPCLVVVIPCTGAPDTSLLPHLGHIAMAGGDVPQPLSNSESVGQRGMLVT